jgi:Arc/MetJ-type ribon-helix-helix transcriptional regulator
MLAGMSPQIAVRLADDDLRRLDAAIARGAFANRAAAVRAGLDRLLRDEREAEIAEAYRRGYAADPEEDAVGEAGLRLGSALLAGDEAAAREPAE